MAKIAAINSIHFNSHQVTPDSDGKDGLNLYCIILLQEEEGEVDGGEQNINNRQDIESCDFKHHYFK